MTGTATVVGSGPNGLAAAITLAQAGVKVTVIEAAGTIGGGARTAEVTLPWFKHDICSAVHPLGAGSPFFRSLPLEQHGLRWLQPDIAMAHPFDDGSAAVMHRSLDDTAAGLGRDGAAYRRLMGPLVKGWDDLAPAILGPVGRPPRHPLLMARFGLTAVKSARFLARREFREEQARALVTGVAAHANVRLQAPFTASFALVLCSVGHAGGWPVAAGGSQAISDALASYFRSLGGEIVTNRRVTAMSELPPSDVTLFDLTPRQVAGIAGHALTDGFRRRLERFSLRFRRLQDRLRPRRPDPRRNEDCRHAGTVHIGGKMDEIVDSEEAVARGRAPSGRT